MGAILIEINKAIYYIMLYFLDQSGHMYIENVAINEGLIFAFSKGFLHNYLFLSCAIK